jgi:hypothetical protein
VWAGATTYYVSNSGSDSSNGTSTSTPWQTIAKVNAQALNPGDSVLFQAGGTWTGTQIIAYNHSGSPSGGPITYGSYGAGAKPIINPSTIISTWSGPVSGVYSAPASVSAIVMLFEDTIPLQMATSSACTDGNWYWSSNTIYYKPTTGIPSNHTVGTVLSAFSYSAGNNGIDTSNQSYITVNGLEFLNAFIGSTKFDTGSSNNIIIENSSFVNCYNGVYWIFTTSQSNSAVINNYFENCAVAATVNPAGGTTAQVTSWTVTGNTIVNAGTTNGTTTWTTAMNVSVDQEGIGVQNCVNCTISRNVITGGNNIGIYLYGNPSSICSGTVISQNEVANNQSNAVVIGGSSTAGYNNNTVAYNLFINNGASSGSGRYTLAVSQGSSTTQQNYVYNNTFYGGVGAIDIYTQNTPNYVTIKNNIIDNPSLLNICSNYFDSTLIIDYNMYSVISLPGPAFTSGVTSETWAQWQGLGYDIHGQAPVNPLFTNNSGSYSLASDFELQPGSPAIDAGVDVGLTSDYAGNPVHNPPSIGAMEYDSTGSGSADASATADPVTGSGGSSGGGGGGGCFIATAAFGSYLDPHVAVLRSFRDNFLLTNRLGKAFVSWYYAASPPYADAIRQNGTLKAVVRIALFPVIGFAHLCLTAGVAPACLMAVVFLAGLAWGPRRLWVRRAGRPRLS